MSTGPDRDEPRWLDAAQQETWAALLGVIARLPPAIDAQLQREQDITHVEYGVMSWLSRRPGRTARMSEVAALNNVTLSHLSRVVTRLEKRGWVERAADPGDGRAILATLTDGGWEKVVAAAPGHVAEVRRRIFDRLDPDQVRQLGAIAGDLLAALTQERG